MVYAPPRAARAKLRSQSRFERAMRTRNVNGSELSRLADVNRTRIYRLRHGLRDSAEQVIARRLEDALQVERGELFSYDESTD